MQDFMPFPTGLQTIKKSLLLIMAEVLYIADVSSGTLAKVASDESYHPGPFRDLFGSWSKDSKWVSYTKITETNFQTGLRLQH